MNGADERLLRLLKDARDKLQSERRYRTEPLAIVGMGCRFPGGASSPAAFWRLLESGVDATSEVPADRWDAEALYDPDPATPGKSYAKRGSFLDAIDAFEPEFFGISPREAMALDPQQRLLLEVAWEALEDAGIVPERLRGSRTGVWVGLTLDDYAGRTLASGDLTRIDAYSALGGARSVAAGRLAYVLDLRGPVMQLDAACASSLVAVHLACQSLRAGECDQALVGAANLMSSPEATVALCKLRALAPDGRCKTFDASADGYGRGEGAGIVVLKRLSDAQGAGDRIHAVIRGSAVNHDGRSNGLTAPNGTAQQEVIRAALDNAAVEASKVGYVEAHGTGTLLGDPIEVLALNTVYRPDRSAESPLYVGSVKTNFGHLEAAAGIAGLIKTVLCLAHRRIAPHLHVRELNPKIPWRDLSVRVTTESTEWARIGASRIAGVSAFGFSGTNAHVLVEEAPAVKEAASSPARSAELMLLSARNDEALRAAAGRLFEALEAHPEWTVGDVAYSLATTRSRMEQRLASVVRTREELSDTLDAVRHGRTPVGAAAAQARESMGKLAWLFTGQGAQTLGMGRELYREWPAFRDSLDDACAAIDEHLDRPLRDVMWAAAGSANARLLDQTAYTQPALFAYGWALAALWRSWGLVPDLLAGHSIGEITAAAVAGVFSLQDAARLVCARGRLMQALPQGGAMVAIAASETDVAPALLDQPGALSIAAVNAPSSVVVSGDQLAVMAVAERFSAKGVDVKQLTVSHAFHSPLMDPVLESFRAVAGSLAYGPPAAALVSTLTGRLAGPEVATADYWVRHVREPVRFADAAQAMHAEGARVFLELGPKATLLPLVASSLADHPPLLLASARAGRSESSALFEALAGWAAHGGRFDLEGLFPHPRGRLDLPTYPWQRRRFWIEEPSDRAPVNGEVARWSYAIDWRRRPLESSPAPRGGRWVIVGASPDGRALEVALGGAGASAISVGDLQDLRRSLEAHRDPRIVVVLDRGAGAERRALEVEQWLASLGREAPRCWWLTRGAVGTSPTDPPAAPDQAVAWGLARTFALEQPHTWGGLVDLPDRPLDAAIAERVAALLLEVQDRARDDQWAVRDDATFVPRLAPRALKARSGRPIATRGTALVTGGLGGLGGHVARWLARRGARHLLLVGRRGPQTPGAQRTAEELRALGAKVTVAAAQVSDREAMRRLLDALPSDAPLTAIFHVAGTIDATALDQLSPDALAVILDAKQTGTWVLDELTRDRALEAFVCFSSIAGVLGSGGQAAYGAANAFLDAWAQAARAGGRKAWSIAWGPWAGVGMATDASARAQLERRGLRAMAPEKALNALERILAGHDDSPCVVADIDWEKYRVAYEAWGPRPVLADLPLGLARAELPPARSGALWAERLRAVSTERRLGELTALVRAEIAKVLAIDSPVDVPLDKPLKELGLDSLMAVELRNTLAGYVGRALPATLVFDQPTPRSIAAYVLDELFGSRAPEPDRALATPAAAEPIAIVGMACRFPGGVTDPESLWRLLVDEVDAVGEVPSERWDVDAWYDPDPDAAGKMISRWGGFLDGIERFDASFFGLSPREAPAVDPQERLLLEATWEAIERAGLRSESLMGSDTGVYMGISGTEYQARAMADVGAHDPYALLGTAHSTMVGRLSYWLGLKGPNMPVDTACSSSLVAVHLACQALRAGECGLAIAGGANTVLQPEATVLLSRLRALSPTGRCRTFSADADGYVRSEGAGVVVLERLSDAQRNGHPILATILGTAVNQDGRSNGLTAPNGPSQQAVIRDALRRGGVAPARVDYVECHGTGTPLGDPIEVQALAAVLGDGRPPGRPVMLGSVKSNLGHMEAAAGMGGLIKTVLMLKHGRIPKSLHFTSPNPHVAWSELPVRVAADATDWPRDGAPRRVAGVSAFGIGGTNAHVLLEEAPATAEPMSAPQRAAEWVLLSARSEAALRSSATRLRDALRRHPEWTLRDVAFSLATTRSRMEERLSCVVPTLEALSEALDAAAHGERPGAAVSARVRDSTGKLAWVFSGQGAQKLGMGRELYGEWPAFREAFDAALAALDTHLDRPLRPILWAEPGTPDAELLDQTAYTQPAIFAFGWALAALWRSWGLHPDALAGHSIGELTAACVAQVFSLSDAARLVCARGRLMQALPAGGAMIAVAAPEAEVARVIERGGHAVDIAAVNAPSSTVVSGEDVAVTAVARQFAARGVDVKRLTVSHAFHSALLDPMLEPFRAVARSIEYGLPSIPLVSGLTGKLAGHELASADYWVRHVRQPVRFAEAVVALHADGARAFLELGPKSALLSMAAASLPDASPLLLASARHGRPEALAVLDALSAWVAHGGDFDGHAVFPGGGRPLDLPTYPWQRQRFWIEAPHADSRVDGPVPAWLYALSWVPGPAPATGARLEGAWAVLGSAPEAQWLGAALSDAGAAARVIENLEELAPLLDAHGPLRVLYLVDRGRADESRALRVQQMVASHRGRAARCWWVTRGAVGTRASNPSSAPDQAVVWGLARTFALEQPGTWGGLVDLPDAALDAKTAGLLARALARMQDEPVEDQVALRGEALLVARLAPRPSTFARVGTLSARGTALVTGGLGGLGLHVARWLARQGAQQLLLVSRAGSSTPEAERAVTELEALGARVVVAAVDVSDREAMTELLRSLPSSAPLTAVFHVAGVNDLTAIDELTPGRLADVLRAKQRGTWVLDELTRDLDLQAFVCFSSIAGVLGSGKQAAYAASNAFLDAWAQAARARGRRALSIAWGPWAGEGMASDGASRAHLERRGLRAMAPRSALLALEHALGRDDAHAIVADIDWDKYRLGYEAWGRRPILDGLSVRAQASPSQPRESARWAETLAPLATEQRLAELTALVRAEVAIVLAMTDAGDVPLERPLKELGFDSLMAVELRNTLARRTGFVLPATLVFDQPTAKAIAAYLLAKLPDSHDRPADPRASLAKEAPEEPIAILGMGCRFPGGVTDPKSLWRLLMAGGDAIGEVPPDRWDVDAWYDADLEAPGKMISRWGGFVEGLDRFEPAFFGLSPREAPSVDPQERLLLETTWEALERAGLRRETLVGSSTGVYMGLCGTEYQVRAMADFSARDPYAMLGTAHSTMVGRLSYWLGLEGPNMPVDTACSSSLVAVHLACQALRSGECRLALAGGANVVLRPETTVFLSRLRALSPTGRCRTFSADADGYVRSEGAGVVVLERLSDARRNGHPVLALIRGTAVNQDGRSNGLTAPSGPAQRAVIQDALRRGDVEPARVSYVECHGTGTPLGDPIEVQALAAALADGHSHEEPVIIGSLKSNLGHMEGAAGIGSLMKAVLMLQHGRIPKTLHFTSPNPHVAWSELPVKVASEEMDWPRRGATRIAGVSAFGISGTNAHAIVEEAPPDEKPVATAERSAELVVLSARTDGALRASAARLRASLDAHPEWELADVAGSLASTRSSMSERLACVVPTREALSAVLEAAADGRAHPFGVRALARDSAEKVAWLFTGQGAQQLGMGRALHGEWPAFRRALDAAFEALDPHLERALRDVMWAEPGTPDAKLLDQTSYTQPALFAHGWAMAALWHSWGVRPNLVAGHSIGELTAACVAGVFSIEDAARLVCARGRWMQALPPGGAMMAIGASEADVALAIERQGLPVAIAAVNAPSSVVVSGDAPAVTAVAELFAARGVETKPLVVSHAFHSPLMDAMLAPFRAVALSIPYRSPSVALVSGLTGRAAGPEIATADHWVRHAREPVRFADATSALYAAGARTFVEMGPKAMLLPLVAASLADRRLLLLASARQSRPEAAAVLDALGAWVAHGGVLDSDAVFGSPRRRLELPTYPWQRERFWIEPSPSRPGDADPPSAHPLLGARVPSAGSDVIYQSLLSARQPSWSSDHRVGGRAVLPGAAVAELLRAAAEEHRGEPSCAVTRMLLQAPLVLPEQGARRVQVVMTQSGDRASVHSRAADAAPEAAWTLHATADLAEAPPTAPGRLDVGAARRRCTEAVDVTGVYAALAHLGLAYGPAFQGLRSLLRGPGEVLADVQLADGDDAGSYGVHPALLDAAMQSIAGLVRDAAGSQAMLPFEFGEFAVYQRGRSSAMVHAVLLEPPTADGLVADVTLTDASGELLAQVKRLHLRRADVARLGEDDAKASVSDSFYRLEWRHVAAPPAAPAMAGRWAVVSFGPSGGSLANDLRAAGADCVEVGAAELADVDADHVVCAWYGPGDARSAIVAAQQGLATVQALVRRDRAPRLWWVTRGAVAVTPEEDVAVGASSLWGLGRTVPHEHPELRCTMLDLEPRARAADLLAREASADGDEAQVAWRADRRHVARLVRAPSVAAIPPTENYRLKSGRTGTLDSLALVAAARRAPGPRELEIEVGASGLNFRDVLVALGIYPGDVPETLGSECAGIVTRAGADVRGIKPGDRVMALAPGSFARFVTADARTVSRTPAGLSMEQAATLPIAFLTAWYALHDLAELRSGDRILIHAAAGGVGMAAVQLARWLGAEVFATASPSKWDVVRSLGVEHVASSRDRSFAEAFRAARIDVVLNSLAGEFVDAGLSLLSRGGRFVEMGKTDLRDAADVAAAHPGVAYRAFDLSDAGLSRIADMFSAVSAGFASGRLAPLPVRTFAMTQAEAAFRFMAQARHVGKLALLPSRDPLRTQGTVLITGGLGALGFEVATALARRGVPHLLLVGRRGMATPGATRVVTELENLGARVTVAEVDVADAGALARTLSALPERWPLRGVVHAAGVLDDGVLSEQTPDRFARVMAPKVLGAWNLHRLTERADLDFFTLFSSMSGTTGSGGQGSYAAANTFLDGLAQHRRALGLPAASVAWGPWAGEGLAASLDGKLRARFARHGFATIAPAQGRALFEASIARPEALLIAARLDMGVLTRSRAGAPVPPLWRALVRSPAGRAASVREADAKGGWEHELAAVSIDQRAGVVAAAVRVEIARVLSFADASDVPLDVPLEELGLDSLMTVELRNALSRRTGVTLPSAFVTQNPTARTIATYVGGETIATIEARNTQDAQPCAAFCESLNSLLGPRVRLFCFHDAGGSPTMFVPFCRLADEGVEVCAVSPGRGAELAATRGRAYLREVVSYIRSRSDRPYVLFGHSLGGMFAWRVLRELADDRCPGPALFVPSASAPPWAAGNDWLRHPIEDDDVEKAFRHVFGARDQATEKMRSAFEADIRLLRSMPQRSELPLDVPIAAFVGVDDHLWTAQDVTSWASGTTREFSRTVLAGGHFYPLEEAPRRQMLDELARRIRDLPAGR